MYVSDPKNTWLNGLAFIVILFFIIIGFASCGCVVFGDHVRAFHNIPSTFTTMLYWVVGDFSTVDYDTMKQANSSFAPLFIGSFLILVVLVAINMFIAILTDFYEEYKEEKEAEERDKETSKTGGSAHLETSMSLMKGLKTIFEMTKPTWRLQIKNVAIAGRNAALLAAVGVPQRGRTVIVEKIPGPVTQLPVEVFIETVGLWFAGYGNIEEILPPATVQNEKVALTYCMVVFQDVTSARKAAASETRAATASETRAATAMVAGTPSESGNIPLLQVALLLDASAQPVNRSPPKQSGDILMCGSRSVRSDSGGSGGSATGLGPPLFPTTTSPAPSPRLRFISLGQVAAEQHEAHGEDARPEDDSAPKVDDSEAEAQAEATLKPPPIYLERGMRVRMHISRVHVLPETEQAISEGTRDSIQTESGEELKRFDSRKIEIRRAFPNKPSGKVVRVSAVSRGASMAACAETDSGHNLPAGAGFADLETGDANSDEEDSRWREDRFSKDGSGEKSALRKASKRKLSKKFESVHYLDAKDVVDKGENGSAVQQTVVLGLLTRRKRGKKGYTLPSDATRQLLLKMKPGQLASLEDTQAFLGDKVALQFQSIPEIVPRLVMDTMSGQEVERRDCYADFLVRVNCCLLCIYMPAIDRSRTMTAGTSHCYATQGKPFPDLSIAGMFY